MSNADKNLKKVRIMADIQFGKGCGEVLFPDGVTFQLSKTKRIRQVLYNGKHMATIRAKDGMLTLSIDGAVALHGMLEKPASRVVICEDAVPFVSKGKTTFAKHVVDVDPDLRAGDEVIVVDASDEILATGQLLLSPHEAIRMGRGPAVDVRRGIAQS
ncbi:PUA domain-containing protein [Methanolobus psychrotolerans]|uniref:PUA domain-containing protein n=1 Tax=Methanolobus psychrotolerans TaxID=1874706 RepID=UPI000B91B0CB|nr:PUA domain-containing protein [Methanolobus psychrotolerans]